MFIKIDNYDGKTVYLNADLIVNIYAGSEYNRVMIETTTGKFWENADNKEMQQLRIEELVEILNKAAQKKAAKQKAAMDANGEPLASTEA